MHELAQMKPVCYKMVCYYSCIVATRKNLVSFIAQLYHKADLTCWGKHKKLALQKFTDVKKIIFLLLLTKSTIGLFAQKDTSDNYVNRFITIPAIKINILPDSTLFTNENLKKNSPFVLMFFNPDCEHCQKETKELLAYKEELKGISILMVSPASYREIKDFYREFGLSSMSNIKIGQDVNYKLGSIYKLKTYPSVFVYDNRGILAKAFVGNIGIPAILDAIK